MGSYSISYLFSPPGCPSPLHSGPGGKKSPFHPSFFLTEEIISCSLSPSDMTGEDENTGVTHWDVTQKQHCSPTSLSQIFLAPLCHQAKHPQCRNWEKNNEAGPGGDFRLLELQFWEHWDPTDD